MGDIDELLTHSCDADGGIRRRRRGKGFSYVDDSGARVTDPGTLARIRALVIPPAWTDVWICLDPAGHIQATGRDAKNRKQYLYHRRWREYRDAAKFHELAEFGAMLPDLRKRVDADMRSPQLGADRVLATLVRLLQYVDGDEARSIGSRDVNEYLGRVTSADCTAKTFRTWGASAVAFGHLRHLEPTTRREHDAQRADAVRIAAAHLHNTPAVCRKSYVHPAILADDRAELDELIERSGANASRESRWMDADERALLKFLTAAEETREAPAA